MSKLFPFSPLGVDQIWEYLTTYHRRDRVRVIKRLRPGTVAGGAADLWETKECQSGDVRNYTESELRHIAEPTIIQIGQDWDTGRAHGSSKIKMLRCFKHGMPAMFSATPWMWEYEHEDDKSKSILGEDLILQWYALFEGTPTPAVNRISNGPCNRCGNPAFTMGITVECGNPKCPNFKP